MWRFGKSTTRRREIRKTRAERGLTFFQQVRERFRVLAVSIAIVSATAAALILNIGGNLFPYRDGQSVARAITSRIGFSIEDVQQTAALRVQARDSSPNFYRLDTSLLDDIRGRLMSALTIARANVTDADSLRREAALNKVVLDDAGVADLQRLANQPDADSFRTSVERALQRLAEQPLVEEAALARSRTAVEAVLEDPLRSREQRLPVAQLMLTNKPGAAAAAVGSAVDAFPSALRPSMKASLIEMLNGSAEEPVRPIYRFNSDRTATAAAEAERAVTPQHVKYARYATLADVGVINARELELLKAEHEAYRRHLASDPQAGLQAMLAITGRSLLAVLVTVGLVGFVYRFKPKAVENPLRQIITAIVLIGLLALVRIVAAAATGIPDYFAIGAQAFAAALLGIVYARVLIFGICGGLAVLLTLATDQGIGFLITLLAVSGTLVFGLRTVRNRGKIVAIGLGAACVASLTTMASGLVDDQTLRFILWEAAWAGGTTLAAAFLVEGLLPWIERVFGVSTAMTLLEWCDANKPLLRLMAAEAPGTYNHSLMVGALAESAAESIGANGLLARAGAYYHDVGKINKPEYFIENQNRQSSRHERLSPAMSLLIIIGHVKDGVEMAREYALPGVLHLFIAEHHGTTLVEYFYHAANKARKPGDPEITQSDFRYPGPRPQSRETAIVMICDGVEGAVRAMSDPTPGRIESVVNELMRRRLLDGQFDDCDLNFRELATIERSIVKSLCGIYHARIAYPGGERKPAAESRSAS